jgi:hypothetical protein
MTFRCFVNVESLVNKVPYHITFTVLFSWFLCTHTHTHTHKHTHTHPTRNFSAQNVALPSSQSSLIFIKSFDEQFK